MDCRFCKLSDIDFLGDDQYKCSYCGYSFKASKWDLFYDAILRMPLSSWLVGSLIWFSAMLTGVIFGLGFNSASLRTTTLFLFLYGISAFLYGGSTSTDFFEAVWVYFVQKIRGQKPDFEEVKIEVQRNRKKRIVKEVTSTQTFDEETGKFIETDIRPGEKKIPYLAPSFKAGVLVLLVGIIFTIVYNGIFPSQV